MFLNFLNIFENEIRKYFGLFVLFWKQNLKNNILRFWDYLENEITKTNFWNF